MSALKEAKALKAKLEADLKEALADKEAALAKARQADNAGAKAAAESIAGVKEQIAVNLKIKLKEADDKIKEALASAQKHIVVSGETLSHISLHYYKTANRWKEIYEANEDVIGDDPGKIKPGQELIIP